MYSPLSVLFPLIVHVPGWLEFLTRSRRRRRRRLRLRRRLPLSVISSGCVGLGWSSGPCACQASTLPAELRSQPQTALSVETLCEPQL